MVDFYDGHGRIPNLRLMAIYFGEYLSLKSNIQWSEPPKSSMITHPPFIDVGPSKKTFAASVPIYEPSISLIIHNDLTAGRIV